MTVPIERMERRIVKAAMRYYRKMLKNGYARYNLCISEERLALFKACASLAAEKKPEIIFKRD